MQLWSLCLYKKHSMDWDIPSAIISVSNDYIISCTFQISVHPVLSPRTHLIKENKDQLTQEQEWNTSLF